jgi:transposase
MTTQRCDCCIGKKTILGLGALIKECPKCKGVGHVKVDAEIKKFTDGFANTAKSGRGRPKKVSNEAIEA